MKIIITQQEIDDAKKFRAEGKIMISNCCPISLAGQRLLKTSVFVGDSFIYIDYTKTYLLPEIARKFVQDFDSRLEVKPFEFELGENDRWKYQEGM